MQFFFPMLIFLTMMIGWRHAVGGDWETYLDALDRASTYSFLEALLEGDPAYTVLNWLAIQLGLEVYSVNAVCAAIFSYGLLTFCRAQPLPWLALVVSVPYLVMVVAMGYTRQGVAIGLAMLALVSLDRGKVLNFVLWMAAAALFHKSAVILLPFGAIVGERYRVIKIFAVAAITLLLYQTLLQDSLDYLRAGYLDARYESSGAAIRVAMNALPAAVFLLLVKRFEMKTDQKIFWVIFSFVAIGFVVLLNVSPSSTAVDRVALYLIPLQMFVWSRLPIAMGTVGMPSRVWIAAVVGYSAVVQFVWLNYAQTAFAWLPYQFYPWVALWG